MVNKLTEREKTRQFVQLIRCHDKRILAFILTMVPNRANAEDILQETLTEMWLKFDSFEKGTDFAAWGVTIAKYMVLRFLKKQKRVKVRFRSDLLALIQEESAQAIDDMSDYMEALRICMQKLSQRQQRFLKLRYEQKQSFREIAVCLAVSAPAVHKESVKTHASLVRCIRRRLGYER